MSCVFYKCTDDEEECMMHGKLKGLALLTAVSLLAAGCSLQGSAETQNTIVVNEDVQLESSLVDSSLDVSRQQDIEVGRKIAYTGIVRESTDNRLYFNENGKFHSLDLKNGEEKELAKREVFDMSENGDWAMSYADGEIFIHHLNNGDMQLLGNGSPEESTFIGDEVAHFDYTTHLLSLMNMETDETTTWDLSNYPDATISSIKKAGDDVYLAARGEEEGFSIYRLSSQGEITSVTNLEGKGISYSEFDLLQNGSVIFNGDYDGKTGIFYWDEQTKDVQQLVAGGKSEEGIWTPFYKLSPDESKLLYDTPVQIEDKFKANVYMAELVDGQVTNSVRIMENADLYAVISYSGDWSKDSKTAYIMTSKDDHKYVGDIAVFEVND